jgi:peptide/nickel transport system permease protein
MKFAIRRVVHGLLLLIGVSILSFLFSELAPGDFYSELRADPRVSAETLATLRSQNGMDRPLPVRYSLWLQSVIRGNFGYSLAYQGPVGPLLAQRIPATLLLTGLATSLAWLLALPVGIWSALRRGSTADYSLQVLVAILLSIPELLLAIVLMALAVYSGRLPAGGMHSPGTTGAADLARHLIVPVTVLTLGLLPIVIRHVRSAIMEAWNAPFALAARAHGIPRGRVVYRHVLPAALHPLISLFGLSLGTLISSSLLVEVIVGWPGIGPLFLEAILARDFALVLGVVMVSTSFLVAGNLIADLLLYRADPRIRS